MWGQSYDLNEEVSEPKRAGNWRSRQSMYGTILVGGGGRRPQRWGRTLTRCAERLLRLWCLVQPPRLNHSSLCVCTCMCQYQLKHARPSAHQSSHTLLTACTASEWSSFLSPVSPSTQIHTHAHTRLTKSKDILFFSWCPDTLPVLDSQVFLFYFVFLWSIFHLSLTLDPSQQVGHLTQVKLKKKM